MDYKPVSAENTSTSGCIRVSQENLEWLIECRGEAFICSCVRMYQICMKGNIG